MVSASVIVLQPGSLWLRLGRGTEASPVKVLHAVARWRGQRGGAHQDNLLLPQAKLDARTWKTLDDARLQVLQALGRATRPDGTRRNPPGSSRVTELNSTVTGEKVDGASGDTGRTDGENEEVVVGDDVLTLDPALPYNIHFPFRRGDLNTHSGIGGSLTSILVDLQDIWTRSIEKHLNISPADFKHFRVVLIIPTLYRRSTIKHYISLILLSMGFGGCFVVQDHVAATFGAGLGAACVVDVGDQKTSISCVEDGVSQPSSRIHLDYGGADVTQVLYFLARKCGFPYKTCNPTNRLDAMLLHSIKEAKCSLDLEALSLSRHLFQVDNRPGQASLRYSLYLGDEAAAAPLALFNVDLLEVTGPKSVRVMGSDPGDSEDPHDHIYLRETSRKYTRTGDLGGDNDQDFEDGMDQLDSEPAINTDTLLPLDQAVCRSIEMCAGEDLRRKMWSSVLLVGGGFRFSGAAAYLQARLSALAGPGIGPAVEVMVDCKDGEADWTSWRGAAVMASMESAQELWIRPREWARHGQKILRERAPFPWA